LQESTSNRSAASAEAIGSPFHNPYTFIPFPKAKPIRHKPTPLTIDELEKDRLSGIIRVSVKTLSPLLTSQPVDQKKDAQRGKNEPPPNHPIMKIGNDVVVPASSVRGALRNMMSIISGGTLSYLDEELWLCQGRDVNLGGMQPKGGPQDLLYLAQIIEPGNSFHDGTIRFGEAKLVRREALERVLNGCIGNYEFAPQKRSQSLWIDNPEKPTKTSLDKTEECSWLVKFSGRKVNTKGHQHEGAFQPAYAEEITVPSRLWKDYQGRNRNSDVKELKKGQLIWLESNKDDRTITDAGDIKSIQWARWGRQGKRLADKLKANGFLPDAFRDDGLVDIVSDLFGSVSMKETYPSFSARVVPENLVFRNVSKDSIIEKNPMPPLSSPHPGCVAFYLDNEDYDAISLNDMPRGYKVYRTTKETGSDAPWSYNTQPVFFHENAKPFRELNMTFSADLLKADISGAFNLSFRALNKEELSLLLLTLSCDFRFGGGKPLGLGHCIATEIELIGEDGNTLLKYAPERAFLPDGYVVPDQISDRANIYCKSQEPVDKLRYPRSISKKGDRGGMVWFAQFADLKKGVENESPRGLQTIWTDGKLKAAVNGKTQIKGQALPKFSPDDPLSDILYGYDVQP